MRDSVCERLGSTVGHFVTFRPTKDATPPSVFDLWQYGGGQRAVSGVWAEAEWWRRVRKCRSGSFCRRHIVGERLWLGERQRYGGGTTSDSISLGVQSDQLDLMPLVQDFPPGITVNDPRLMPENKWVMRGADWCLQGIINPGCTGPLSENCCSSIISLKCLLI